MRKRVSDEGLTRRQMILLSASGGSGLGARLAFPELIASAEEEKSGEAREQAKKSNLYASLLQTWCDGLLAHQVSAIQDPALHGGLLCPACGMIHGRCGDAVYPLLRVAQSTGDAKYLKA